MKNIIALLFFLGLVTNHQTQAAARPAIQPDTLHDAPSDAVDAGVVAITAGVAGIGIVPNDPSRNSFMQEIFGGEAACHHIGTVQCFKSGSPIAELNRVWTPNETVSDSQLKKVVKHMGKTRYCWWIHRSQKALAEKLRAAGFTVQTETETLMMTNLVDNREIHAKDKPWISVTKHEKSDSDYRYHEIAELAAVGQYSTKNITFYSATYADNSVFEHIPAASCMVITNPTTKTISLHVVSTIPEFRNKGLATALSKFALREARSMGYTKAILLAPSGALSLYKKLGFNAVGGENAYSIYKNPEPSRCVIL